MNFRSLLLTWFIAAGPLAAAPHPAARIIPGNDAGDLRAVIAIEIVDEQERPIPDARIRIAASSAADRSGANVFLTAVKDGKETPLAAPKRVTAPDSDGDGFAKSVNIFLPAQAVAGTTYKVTLRPAGSRPVLTYRVQGKQFTIAEPIVLDAGGPDKIDTDFLERSAPLKSSVELGGGDEGALLSLRLRYGKSASDNHRLIRFFANMEADLTPNSEAADSVIYGHILGEVNGLWQVPFREGGYFQGSAFYGLTTSFESDQDFNNWNAGIGLTGWWFVNCDALRKFGDLLRLSRDADTPVHPLAFKLTGNYLYATKRDAAQEDAGDFQVSARAIWLNRIYSNAGLPLTAVRFDVNLLVDAGATWEADGADVHPTVRVSLEFQPVKFKDSNLAFTLTYAKGEFSPTFVDEDAFLAGLKLRF